MTAARRPVVGADRVARFLLRIAEQPVPGRSLVQLLVNGTPGLALLHGEQLLTVAALLVWGEDQVHAASVTRTGFDRAFLPVDVPLPDSTEPAITVLDYTHFSVGLNTGRRLAAWTAVNIDGAHVLEVPRGDDWHLDPRVTPDQSLPRAGRSRTNVTKQRRCGPSGD